jgi:hypothetical protein
VSSIIKAVRMILFRPRRAFLLGRIGIATLLFSVLIKCRPLPAALLLFFSRG